MTVIERVDCLSVYDNSNDIYEFMVMITSINVISFFSTEEEQEDAEKKLARTQFIKLNTQYPSHNKITYL